MGGVGAQDIGLLAAGIVEDRADQAGHGLQPPGAVVGDGVGGRAGAVARKVPKPSLSDSYELDYGLYMEVRPPQR